MSKAKTKQKQKHNITTSFAIEFRNSAMSEAVASAVSRVLNDVDCDCTGNDTSSVLERGWVACELDGGTWEFAEGGVAPRKSVTARYGHDELHLLVADLAESLKPAKSDRMGGFDLVLTPQGVLRIGCKTLTPKDLLKVADSLGKVSNLTGSKADDGITVETEYGSSVGIYLNDVSIDGEGTMSINDAKAVLRWAGVKTAPDKKAKANKK